MSEVTIDFVALDDDRDACVLVLVEENWGGSIKEHLRKLQERLYGCLEATLDGEIAKKFPKSVGRNMIIRVDCYDIPCEPVDDFVVRFSTGIRGLPEYSFDTCPFVRELRFEVDHHSL